MKVQPTQVDGAGRACFVSDVSLRYADTFSQALNPCLVQLDGGVYGFFESIAPPIR